MKTTEEQEVEASVKSGENTKIIDKFVAEIVKLKVNPSSVIPQGQQR